MPKAIRQSPPEDVIDPYKKVPLRKIPWPPKTYVTGKTQSGVLGLVDHRHHGGLFEIVWRMQVDDTVASNSGWHVILRCVYCNERTPCDGEFAMVRVKSEDITRWYGWATEVCKGLMRSIEEVEKAWPQGTA